MGVGSDRRRHFSQNQIVANPQNCRANAGDAQRAFDFVEWRAWGVVRENSYKGLSNGKLLVRKLQGYGNTAGKKTWVAQ